MFFHIDSIRKFRNSIQSWRFITIVIIVIVVKGVGDNKGENQLLIINGEGEFNKNALALLVTISKQQFFEAYNGSHYAMVLIKNVTTTTTTKGNQYLKAQHYII